MIEVGKPERMTKRKHTKRPRDPAIDHTDDVLTRELREAARFLIDVYLWRKRLEKESTKPTFDDDQ